MAQARATFGRSKARPNRAREWESQSRSLEERERTTQRPRAEGQRTIQPSLGITLALAPRRGGSGIGEAFVRRLRNPKRRRAALLGNDQVGTNTGTILAQRPKRRGAAGLRSFFSVVVFRETKVGQSQRGKAPPDPTEKKLLTHHQIARNKKRSARLAAVGRKQLERTTLYPPPMTTDARPLAVTSLRSCARPSVCAATLRSSICGASPSGGRIAANAAGQIGAQLLRLDCAKPERGGWAGSNTAEQPPRHYRCEAGQRCYHRIYISKMRR